MRYHHPTEMLPELHKYSYVTSSTNGGSKVSNLGRTKTVYKVFQRYYWPGIFNNIEQVVSFISATQLLQLAYSSCMYITCDACIL